jgi:hypothetical protein
MKTLFSYLLRGKQGENSASIRMRNRIASPAGGFVHRALEVRRPVL